MRACDQTNATRVPAELDSNSGVAVQLSETSDLEVADYLLSKFLKSPLASRQAGWFLFETRAEAHVAY
jgi:hypothetical protein